MLFALLLAIAAVLFVIERRWPAQVLPKVENWWQRVIFVNVCQFLIVILAGLTWDRWLASVSLFDLSTKLSTFPQAVLAYFISTFVYYWWHRYRHESRFFWRLCHQLHHSPRRIELLTSFYKHPVEIVLNSMLSAILVYAVLGCSVKAGAIYTALTAIAEYFYHLNLRTPFALGYLIQRPESHRIHHKHRHHTQNFADLPIWDILFGTFVNPTEDTPDCGYQAWQEDRFEDMLGFRDVLSPDTATREPLKLLPTCFGCSKRWACTNSAQPKSSTTSKPEDHHEH